MCVFVCVCASERGQQTVGSDEIGLPVIQFEHDDDDEYRCLVEGCKRMRAECSFD